MKVFLDQPWLKSPSFDLSLILMPSVISVAMAFALSPLFGERAGMPGWAWVILVLGIDVSHVYGTLFRTYFNSNELKENKVILTLIPLSLWILGMGLYTLHDHLFWSVLAYVAVFHFIRQQYGFMKLYTRNEKSTTLDRCLATSTCYLATLYPLMYWHAHQPRNFRWFTEDDFILGLPPAVSDVAGLVYLGVGLFYLVNEVASLKRKALNLPKNMILLGTAISWYFGIVHFNGDLIFTMTNVISHGIPYLALIWLYGERQKDQGDAPLILGAIHYRVLFSRFSVPIFLGVLFIFGFFEEGFWAGLVWREHLEVFGPFRFLPAVTAKETLSWLVPLLTLPQATHYVLDGFI